MSDARQDRGIRTKRRLLAAATRLFAERGFEGAGTRDIALAAETTLPSITHHFGSKAGLYHAVLADIDDAITAELAPAVVTAAAMLAEAAPHSYLDALGALRGLLAAHARVILGADPDWTLLVVREQLHPALLEAVAADPFGECFLPLVIRLVAILMNVLEDDDRARVRALGLVGRVLVFRSTRRSALRLFGWPTIDRNRIAMVVDVLDREIEALFPQGPSIPLGHEAARG